MTVNNHRKQLPKAGVLCQQWVRCGRPGCVCRSGRLHGPYMYHFHREDGLLQKRYVRLADVAAVRAAMAAEKAQHRIQRLAEQQSQDQWRMAVTRLREVEDYVRANGDAGR
jgi:hypothetical protein